MLKSKLCFLALILLAITACNHQARNTLTSNDAHTILLAKKQSGDSLSFWDYRKLDSVNLLVGVYTNSINSRVQIYTVRPAAGVQPLHLDTLSDATHLTKTEWVSINGRTLLVIDYLIQGKSAAGGKAAFNLYDPLKGSLFTLAYSYTYKGNNIRGNFEKKTLDSLNHYPQERAFLQKEAGMSKLVPAADKINRRPSADSALKKWAMLNEGVYDALDDKATKNMHLNVEEYNSDISPRLEDYNNDTLAFKSNTFVAENTDYKAVSQVRGPVFVLNKRTNKSFIIWAPPQNQHWINKLKFKGPGLLLLVPGAQDTAAAQSVLQVNIPQKTIEKISTPKPGIKGPVIKPQDKRVSDLPGRKGRKLLSKSHRAKHSAKHNTKHVLKHTAKRRHKRHN